MLRLSRREWAWCFYDVGNSAFYTTIVAGFFPVFFKEYWSQGVAPSLSTSYLSFASSIAALVVALLSPALGMVASRTLGKSWLIGITGIGILSCFMLAFLGPNQAGSALLVFAVGSASAALALTIYDSMMTQITTKDRYNQLSLAGYAFGYLGGGILLALNCAMTLNPELFYLSDKAQAVKVSFISVGVWWLIFLFPLIKWVPQQKVTQLPLNTVFSGFSALYHTASKIVTTKHMSLFLLAYWCYIDGVGTVMRMAVDYGMSLGFSSNHLIVALLIVQFLSFPCALGFIYAAEKIGAKNGLYIGIAIYCVITIGAYFMTSVSHFYLLACGVALAQGGLQALSRSYFAHMIPKEQSGEYFGFYNTVGKVATIFGPLAVGVVALVSGSNRLAILSILILFLLGAILLGRSAYHR
ncbi:MAG: MFS transporter [Proteobacteria bacterium]|nr:MFS transporter [Pseudomonadota bacterium]